MSRQEKCLKSTKNGCIHITFRRPSTKIKTQDIFQRWASINLLQFLFFQSWENIFKKPIIKPSKKQWNNSPLSFLILHLKLKLLYKKKKWISFFRDLRRSEWSRVDLFFSQFYCRFRFNAPDLVGKFCAFFYTHFSLPFKYVYMNRIIWKLVTKNM